jgi:hypothetical protein
MKFEYDNETRVSDLTNDMDLHIRKSRIFHNLNNAIKIQITILK